MNTQQQLELQAWVDEELDPSRAASAAVTAAGDPEARALAENLRAFRSVIRTHEPQRAVAETREFYWSGIRRGIEEAARRASPETPHKPVLMRWLAWLIPATGVAVAVMVTFRPPSDSRPGLVDASVATAAMRDHAVETPAPAMNSMTFYSAQDAMTVVWVEHSDVL